MSVIRSFIFFNIKYKYNITLSSDYYKVISFCLRKIPMIKFLRDNKNIST